MLKIHHLRFSQSERIVWLFEELGIPYEIRLYHRLSSGLAPPEFKALHPTGSSPVVEDGATMLAESGAIIQYVAYRYGDGRLMLEPDDPNYFDFLYWFHYANASLGCNLLVELMVGAMPAEHRSEALSSVVARVDLAYRMADERLAKAAWFAGDQFSAADIMMVFHLTTMRLATPRDISVYPALRDYLARVGQRPGYQRALAKCEPGFTPVLA